MPGYLLTFGSQVSCAHGAPALSSAPAARVTVMGQPVVTQPAPHNVAGCSNVTPAGAPLPCVTVQWITAAAHVTVMGQPVLLEDSEGIAIETGTPPSAAAGQARVKGM
jgi:hypothetical protein